MLTDRFRPTFLGTLRQTAALTRAVWSDYFEFHRLARRHVRAGSDGNGWVLLGLTLSVAAAGALFWAHSSGAWSVFVAWLGAQLGGVN